MGEVLLLSLTASLNPTLVGATTVMLLLPSPTKLMLGYLLGAMMTSITLGLVIVFTLSDSGASKYDPERDQPGGRHRARRAGAGRSLRTGDESLRQPVGATPGPQGGKARQGPPALAA